MEWEYRKEFDSMAKLTQYLNSIQNLEKAQINNIGYDKWILSFNLW